MQAEAAPLIAHLGLAKCSLLTGPLSCDCYSGTAHGVTVHVITNGALPFRAGSNCAVLLSRQQ